MKKFLLLIATLSIGCSSSDLTTPTQETLAGRWNLISVEGARLPYSIPQIGSIKREIIEDVLTLTAPNAFTEVTTVRLTQNGVVTTQTVSDAGTYEVNSFAIDFRFQSNGTFGAGTLTGGKLTITTSGLSFTFEKQR